LLEKKISPLNTLFNSILVFIDKEEIEISANYQNKSEELLIVRLR
jgi:hypothetical protein